MFYSYMYQCSIVRVILIVSLFLLYFLKFFYSEINHLIYGFIYWTQKTFICIFAKFVHDFLYVDSYIASARQHPNYSQHRSRIRAIRYEKMTLVRRCFKSISIYFPAICLGSSARQISETKRICRFIKEN